MALLEDELDESAGELLLEKIALGELLEDELDEALLSLLLLLLRRSTTMLLLLLTLLESRLLELLLARQS
jgi:hypothetical protein